MCGRLAEHHNDAVKWPSLDECRRSKAKFFTTAGFPSVIGAVDGTHIRIQAPHVDEPSYVNRKGFHSINVQCVCDADGKFINVNAAWPGCSHDSHIFRTSSVCRHMENVRNWEEGVLLGDSGYPCRPFLLTPYLHPAGPAEQSYNNAHSKTRNCIERVFGTWKRRFHVLHSEIRMKPERVVRVILACAVLHNIAVMMREPAVDWEDYRGDEAGGDVVPYNGPQDGQAVRNHITQVFFAR